MGATLGTVIVSTTDAQRLAEFYRRGLGIDPFRAHGDDHLGARVGSVYFGFDRVEAAPCPGPVSVWFAVDDLEAAFERFLSLGAKERMKPTEKPWGDRIASVEDPDGNAVGLSQRR